eukprot:CAMPEP_0179838220 /NCGR_PEP_ID=MMETSP0982-20121206/545_1 /TAXON_ID=483367 /ORGANISM="non described non described, Strain CCMP 2436" /LENGTH=72 /DNA_ID=CAMNT_0021721547 /DNA_START=640 /DNA_END=858 /DNA_ORIENTATION=+
MRAADGLNEKDVSPAKTADEPSAGHGASVSADIVSAKMSSSAVRAPFRETNAVHLRAVIGSRAMTSADEQGL